MKKFISVFLAFVLLMFVLTACNQAGQLSSDEPERSAVDMNALDPATPEGALALLMEALIDADLEEAMKYVTEPGTVTENDQMMANRLIRPLFANVRYEIGAQVTDGSTAQVKITVTAPDANKMVGELAGTFAKEVALKALKGEELDEATALAMLEDYFDRLDASQFGYVTTDAVAYMEQGGDGLWRMKNRGSDNEAFANALTGGLLDTISQLGDYADMLQGFVR